MSLAHGSQTTLPVAGAVLAIGIAFGLCPTPVLAASPEVAGASESLFLMQVIALLLVGRVLGEVMQRIGQPAVMGQLIGGILLGPSVFGALWPEVQHALFPNDPQQKAMLDAVSQLGILLLLLLTGMETDLALVRKVRRAAFTVSVSGIAVPFTLGFLLGELLPASMLPRPDLRLVTSLFLGTALSISSVKIVAMVVREMNFMRRTLGQVIVASAIIDDTIGWVIIAIIFGIASHGGLELGSLAKSLIGVALFLAASFTFGRRLVFLLIRWVNDTFVSEVPVVTAILIVMGIMALITSWIGVHSVLGAFVAGILVGQSPILTRHIDERLRGLIVALFMPVFFGLAGLTADLTILGDPALLLLTAGLIVIASMGKFGGAFLGGWLGGLTRAESLALGMGMNARGSTEVIVATIGLSIGALSQDLFTMIVAMAILTTLAMPPTLRWALRIPLSGEERQRLEREAFEARAFLPRLERLLVAVDESPKGKFASRLAGLIAGSRGMPVTMLRLRAGEAEAVGPGVIDAVAEGVANAVQTVAATGRNEDAAAQVEILERRPTAANTADVATEARKGYGLLVIGLDPTVGPEGGIHPEVAQVASGFDGPLAIATARRGHEDDPLGCGLDILVPVTGTEVSRRGAEVALALAKASGAPATALYVAGPPSVRSGSGRARRDQQAILRDVLEMAEQYGVSLRTSVRSGLAPAEAILRQARLGGHNLIVMGVTRRAGETLAFGEVADAALEASDRSLLLVVT